jgi:hypothetical protein
LKNLKIKGGFMVKCKFIWAALSLAIFSGCGLRVGYTPDMGFVNPNTIGRHGSITEGSGMLYTLRGGTIDLAHVRRSGDAAKRAYDLAYSCIAAGEKSFTLRLFLERTTNTVSFQYPADWRQRPMLEKEQIARAVAIEVGPVVGYNWSLYHEMLTWKGTRFFLIEPEFKSAFSWEDLYSNILGVTIAMRSVQEGRDYNKQFTRILNQELDRLGGASKEKAIEITRSVKGRWYKGAAMIKRNMDSGADDNVTPCIVPGFTTREPVAYRLPSLEAIERYGIKVTYTIDSPFDEDTALKKMAGRSGSLEPLEDFKVIMEGIETEAVLKYGFDINI